MNIYNLLNKNGLNIEKLTRLSYKSSLGKSLKKNLHYFDKDILLSEIGKIIDWYDDAEQGMILEDVAVDYRVKSKQSAYYKYERYFPNNLTEKVFNDLLGFRSLCDSYSDILALSNNSNFRLADMSNGKANDDGYRGIHVYFQIDHYHYPIEIQYNTYYDRQMNNWLHTYLYKKNYDNIIGQKMRLEYEKGNIRNVEEFLEVLNYVLSCS